MKSSISLLVLAGLVAGLATSPALAQVILEDHFTGEVFGAADTVGGVWQLTAGGTVPLVDGRAIFDPSINNPITVNHPVLGEVQAAEKIQARQRFRPPIDIPSASSERMIELTLEIMDRGAESTPNLDLYPDLTHNDVEVGEIWLASGLAELYAPAFGSPFGPAEDRDTGTYVTGFTCNGAGQGCPTDSVIDSGVLMPGFGESHLLRSRIRSLPTGHGVEIISDVSTDGGASYLRIGRRIIPYGQINGSDAETPGLFTSVNYLLRGGKAFDGDPDDEGEMSSDFIKMEEIPLAPPDKGDMDIDGDVDFDDINDFVLGLNDANAYRSTYWVEASQNGDIDMDGDQDFDDISGFVGILSGGGNVSVVPEPTTLLLAVLGALGVVGYRWRNP